jgi:dienelactone hydrolase
MAYDDKAQGKRPGVLVVHEWWGLNDFIREKAKALAAMGYVAFAPDMYGEGRTTADMNTASMMAGEVRGTPRMRERAVLGYNVLGGMANVDTSRIAAIGFCFGGTAVLELAYSNAGAKGVVAFHAGLVSPAAEDLRRTFATKLLVLHGAADPFTPPDSVRHFQETLKNSTVDWQIIFFGNAVHGFTNPSNGTDPKKGLAYNAVAARRSWKYMQEFLDELFVPAPGAPEAGAGRK